MLQEAVGAGIDVLQHDRVEARQVLGEELVDWKWNQGQLVLRRARVVLLCAKDEKRDQIDARIGFEERPQSPDVVGRSSSDVQNAGAIAADFHGE